MNNIDQAYLDPTSVFQSPDQVIDHPDLSNEQKIKILRRWEYDARELEVAEEENMGGEDSDILDRILRALLSLGAEVDYNHEPPTKQGGE